jgi:uncharacterized protein HemX
MLNFKRSLKDAEQQLEKDLEQTLRDFRTNAHAWSEAVYTQPHMPVKIYKTSWKVAAGWALGCVLAAGSLAGGLYEHHRVQDQEKIAAARAAHEQKLAAQQRQQSEDLLAKIDTDVSREVPSAMEPLAQLMAEDAEQ